MNIGEAVAVLTDSPSKCPFCDSTASSKFEEKKMKSDSTKLATNMKGMPDKNTKNPDAEEKYYIFNTYWVNNDSSRISLNAHHIIPGNASLASCPEILKWMAGTVSSEKIFYDKEIDAVVKKEVDKSKHDEKRSELVQEKAKKYSVDKHPDIKRTFSTEDGKSGITRARTVKKNLVTGQVNYEVNDPQNGVWLPSNNAISKWSEVKTIKAKNQDGIKDDFNKAYAYNTKKATGMQFHDAHSEYSEAVIDLLIAFEAKLQTLAKSCEDHTSPSKKGGPYPAPARLEFALYKLAKSLENKLDFKKTKKPKKPWYTSKLSLE